MNLTSPIDRQAIRAFIGKQRSLLEQAQANGTFARTKLDILDTAESSFQNIPPDQSREFRTICNEELEAFCYDVGFAPVINREKGIKRQSIFRIIGRVILGLFGLAATIFIILFFIGSMSGQLRL